MQGIIAIVLVLGALIFFHELGHFFFARLFGVGVRTFSLGFGPKLFGFKSGQTDYKISAVPLGGYVQMVGETRDAEIPEGFREDQGFSNRPAWQRMIVVAAGPVFNFLLACVIYWILLWAHGQTMAVPEVGKVVEDSPAAEAGIREGDRIVSINDAGIDYWHQLVDSIRDSRGRPLEVTVRRDGSTMTFDVRPEVRSQTNIFGEEIKHYMLGVQNSGETVTLPMGPGEALIQGALQTYRVTELIVLGIVKLVERVVPLETVGGPIMIAQLVNEQAKEGLANVLALTAVISINLGLINLLPIPVLDGGHILFFGLEAVTGKPIPEKWQIITTRIGIAILVAIMALALFNDLQRIFWASSS
jgi:regulator of sigma E protease